MPVNLTPIDLGDGKALVPQRHCTLITFDMPTDGTPMRAIGQFHKITKLPDGTEFKREFDGAAELSQEELTEFEHFGATYQFLSTHFHAKRAAQDEPQQP